MKAGLLLTIATVLFIQLRSSTACTCIRQHPQTQFCHADYVVRGTIKRSSRDSNRVNYLVDVLYVYKVNSTLARKAFSRNPVQITSPLHSCGATFLQPGETYVFGGNMDGRNPSIWLCNLLLVWKHITPHQRQGLSKNYRAGCRCQINPGIGGPEFPANETCEWDGPRGGDCLWRFGTCSPTCHGCEWSTSPEYNTCLIES